MRTLRALSAGLALLVTGLVLYPWTAASIPSDPPNILLIMTDDHAWPLYNFMYDIDEIYDATLVDANGNPKKIGRYYDGRNRENLRPITFPALTKAGQYTVSPPVPAGPMTPELDRLAERGGIFPFGYSADSVCVPSFATTEFGLNKKDWSVLKEPELKSKRKSIARIGDYITTINDPGSPAYVSVAFGKSWKGYRKLGFTCAQKGAADKCKPHKKGHRQIEPLFDRIVDAMQAEQPWFAWYSNHLPHADFDGRELVDSGCAQCAENAALPQCLVTAGDPNRLELPTSYFTMTSLCSRLREAQARMINADFCFRQELNCPGGSLPPECSDWTPADLCADGYEYLRFSESYREFAETIILEDFWMGLVLDFLDNDQPSLAGTACGGSQTCSSNWRCCLDDGGQPISRNTLMMYQTDNGMIPEQRVGKDVPSAGWKKSVDENGFRTPILVSWPQAFPGTEVKTDLTHAIDLIPTMLHAATEEEVRTCDRAETPIPPEWRPAGGGQPATWVPANPTKSGTPCLEGRSLLPALTSGSTPNERTYMFAQKGSKKILRTPDGYRLFSKRCGTFRLYHLPTDLDEDCDLIPLPAGLNCPGPRPAPECICYWEELLNDWYSTKRACTERSEGCTQSGCPPGCPCYDDVEGG